MKGKHILSELVTAFFISTTLITLGSGILGSIYFKEASFGYESFLSPPIFGLLSSFFGLVSYSRKELSIAQAVLRKGIHLLLIEAMIFGLNYFSGVIFTPGFSVILAIFIMFIFIAVHVIVWLNDKWTANAFNKELELFQKRLSGSL